MKLFLVFSSIVVVVLSVPRGHIERRYDPREEDVNRLEYIIMQDEEGTLHYSDLTVSEERETRVSPENIMLYLYTRKNFYWPQTLRLNTSELCYTNFDRNLPTIFLVHGWKNNQYSECNILLKNTLIQDSDVNVVIVDWGRYANGLYTLARLAVPQVGKIVGNYINEVVNMFQISPDGVTIIGYSLGAHIAGVAGSTFSGSIGTIVGLDPANPLFTLSNLAERLDPGDAQFVHVIHTNAGNLGFSSALGHADYYPNGGSTQAGCGFDLFGTCAHARSYLFYAESINSSEFLAHKCDSYRNYNMGRCAENPASSLGQFIVDRSAYGDYYLNTARTNPFALG